MSGRIGKALSWRTLQLAGERGIALLRFLILARLLAPEDFGLLAIATVSWELFGALSDFGIRQALIQRADHTDAHRHAAWTIGLARAMVISAVLLLGAPLIAGLFGEPESVGLLRLIAFAPLLDALVSIRTTDLERALDFRSLAMVSVPPAIVHTALAVVLAPLIGVQGVVWGLLGAQVVGIGISYRLAPYRPRLVVRSEATRDLLAFGRWMLLTSIIGVVGEFALRAIVTRQLGAGPLGLYYLAARLVGVPGAVGVIVGAVAFPLHVHRRHEDARARRIFQGSLKAVAALLTPAYLALVVLAPLVTTVVLGERWTGSAGVIQVLSMASLAGFVAIAAAPVFEGRGIPRKNTTVVAGRSGVVLMAVWWLTGSLGIMGAALAVLLGELVAQVLAARGLASVLAHPFRDLARPAIAVALAGVLSGLPGYAAGTLGGWQGLALGAVVLSVVYVGAFLHLDRRWNLRFMDDLASQFPLIGRLRPTS